MSNDNSNPPNPNPNPNPAPAVNSTELQVSNGQPERTVVKEASQEQQQQQQPVQTDVKAKPAPPSKDDIIIQLDRQVNSERLTKFRNSLEAIDALDQVAGTINNLQAQIINLKEKIKATQLGIGVLTQQPQQQPQQQQPQQQEQ